MDIEFRNINEVVPYANNPREANAHAVEAIAHSIHKYGFRQPIVVDADGIVIAGHGRLEAAKSLGLSEVPVHVAHLSEEEAAAYRIDDNRIGELSHWSLPKLVDEIDALPDDMLVSFSDDEITELISSLLEGDGQLPSFMEDDEQEPEQQSFEGSFEDDGTDFVTLKFEVPKHSVKEIREAIETLIREWE